MAMAHSLMLLQSGRGRRRLVCFAGFFDYNNDGLLDLFVTRYMEWDADHNKICANVSVAILVRRPTFSVHVRMRTHSVPPQILL